MMTALIYSASLLGFVAALIPADYVGLPIKLACLFTGILVVAVVAERRSVVTPANDPPSAVEEVYDTRRRALIVGAGTVGRSLADALEIGGHYRVVGFVDDQIDESGILSWPVLGSRAATTSVIEDYAVDEVFVAYAPTWQVRLAEQLLEAKPEVRLTLVPSPVESLLSSNRVESVGDIALVRISNDHASPKYVKRVFDISMALLGLVITIPLTLLVAFIIKATSRGPIIFAQERVGYKGRPFVLLKFRTMVDNAERSTGPILAEGNADSRLTSVGKWLKVFRLDELPQLINVLKGEMSIVGPRPERPFFVAQFERQSPVYARRHLTRPGITGLAQVKGGYHTHWRDKLRFDLHYVAHSSLRLDLAILIKTVLVVLLPNRRK